MGEGEGDSEERETVRETCWRLGEGDSEERETVRRGRR